jgi:hypothetical protein
MVQRTQPAAEPSTLIPETKPGTITPEPGLVGNDYLPENLVPETKPAAGPLGSAYSALPARSQVSRVADMVERSLGGTPLEGDVSLREQLQALQKSERSTPLETAERTALKRLRGMSDDAVNALSDEEVHEKLTERMSTRQFAHTNGDELDRAIPYGPEGNVLRAKLHALSNIELRQLAINLGEDMSDEQIGRAKASGRITREEVFNRLLKHHSADEIGRAVDDGLHLPPVSGGSARAAALARRVGATHVYDVSSGTVKPVPPEK